jgi:hypothetical protein
MTALRTYAIRCDVCGYTYLNSEDGPLAGVIRRKLRAAHWRHVIAPRRDGGPSKSMDFCAHCVASGKARVTFEAEGGDWDAACSR